MAFFVKTNHKSSAHRPFFIFHFSFFVLPALALSAVGPGTTIETFDANIGTWDELDWVPGSLTDEADTSPPDGLPDSIQISGGQLNVDEVYYRGAVHLELDNVPTDQGVRLDANAFQHPQFQSNMEHWGLSVVIWFDANNWVSLARVKAGLQGGNSSGGYERITRINGGQFRLQFCGPCMQPPQAAFFFDHWAMQGIEITPTEIKFYASPHNVDTFGSVDFDGNMTLDLGLDMARPASFVGPATLIVGKGYADDAGDPWDEAGGPPHFNPKVIGIDATRVILPQPVIPDDILITDIGLTGLLASVSFGTESGATYHLEANTGLVSSAWADTGAFVVADGGTSTLNAAVGASVEKSYRVAPGAPDLGIHFVPLWDIDPYDNFGRNRAPAPQTPPVQPIEVQMAQGEYRDALFMIGPPTNGQISVNVQVDDFGGLPAGMILVQETLYVRNKPTVGPDQFTGDAVYPLTGPLVVPPGESRQVRLRFDARYSGVQPGIYPFNVIVSDAGGGGSQVTIPGTLEVWDFSLPSIEETPSHNWVQIKATQWTAPVLENGIREMKKYGPNYIYVSHTELPKATFVDSVGNIVGTMNYSSFDHRVSSPLTPWQAAAGNEQLKYVFHLDDTTLGQVDDGIGQTITFPGANWDRMFEQWIDLFRDRLLNNFGVGNDRWMLVLADEAGESNLINNIIPLAEAIKSIDSTITLCDNSSKVLSGTWSNRYHAAFEIFQPNLQHLEANPNLLAYHQAHGKTLWTYKAAGNGGLGFDVYRYYRSFGWRAIHYGMEGIGLWTYCANRGGAPQYDWPGYNPGGVRTSHGLILVWQHWANNDIVHCRRYEMYRETHDDIRYIRKLRSDAAAAGGQAPADAEALIDQATTDIINSNSDHTRCDFWRKQIAAEILSLQ